MEFTPNLQISWLDRLQKEINAPYFKELMKFIEAERKINKIFPEENLIFEAFNQTSFEEVKVVIIGQDPYHGINQANGLSFSVKKGIKTPPSLRNIYKELRDDLGLEIPSSGDLLPWAKKGVLMLNATLTVRSESPGSHQNKGWEDFTDAVISLLSEQKENLVFVLWGKFAQNKGSQINPNKHHIIKSAHPSPFAAHRGFFGSKPFSKTNTFLQSKGIKPVDWKL